jgi:hypothetical protein
MVTAALISFAILVIGWLVAPGDAPVAKQAPVAMEGRLAEAA